MPFALRKVSSRCFQVYNKKSKKIYSKCSTKHNAEAQLRLLRAIEFGKNFVLRPRNTLRKTRKQKSKK
jgi:hypothetical protein